MFDKTFWKYFPFSSSLLLSPQPWCSASLFQVGLSVLLLCVNKDIHENWGCRSIETHIRPSWARKEFPGNWAVGLTLKDYRGTCLCLFPWLLWTWSWSPVRVAGGKQRLLVVAQLFLLQWPGAASQVAPGSQMLQEKPLLPADGEGWWVQGDSESSMLHAWL